MAIFVILTPWDHQTNQRVATVKPAALSAGRVHSRSGEAGHDRPSGKDDPCPCSPARKRVGRIRRQVAADELAKTISTRLGSLWAPTKTIPCSHTPCTRPRERPAERATRTPATPAQLHPTVPRWLTCCCRTEDPARTKPVPRHATVRWPTCRAAASGTKAVREYEMNTGTAQASLPPQRQEVGDTSCGRRDDCKRGCQPGGFAAPLALSRRRERGVLLA